jgi:UDP:flavonoid glycosyltransferase YjiC (YdhE family)
MAEVRHRLHIAADRADDVVIADSLPPVFYAGWRPRPPGVVPFLHRDAVGPADAAPDWLAALPPRPTIYVSFGSFLEAGAARLLRILRAIAHLPVQANVIVAAGNSTSDALVGMARRYIPDVVIEPFLPQCAILRAASLLVTHAGITSIKEAVTAGVPMVLVPMGNDTDAVADRCAQLELGVRVRHTSPPAELARALSHALGSGRIHTAVNALRDEMLALPPIDRLVERLARSATAGARR